MAIAKPQVLVFQEFSLTPIEVVEPLRAHISGANMELHRYSEADEKALIGVGEYDRVSDTCYTWPGRVAGSVVAEDSVRLFADDALLLYHEDLISDFSGGRGTVTSVPDRTNWITSSTLSYKTNGEAYPRSSLFNDRDVQVGDRVLLRGVTNPDDDCESIELWTYVDGFAAEAVDATIDDCAPGANNQADTIASASIAQTGGPDNCVAATVDGASYSGLADGDVCETYTITVVTSSISGCAVAKLRVVSASGNDDVAEADVEEFGVPTDIGTRGLTVTFENNSGSSCSSNADEDSVDPNELIVGQVWQISVCEFFEKVCCTAGGSYLGPDNDTYIVEVTKGGIWSALPQVTVTTVKGLDASGPVEVTATNTAVAAGTYGLTISFGDCQGSSSSSGDASWEGDSNVDGLRKGDKFYVTVTSGQNGPIRTLILRDDVPTALADAADLDLSLFLVQSTGFEISRLRLPSPPLVNWTFESTQLCVESGITVYDSTWTDGGVEQPLTLYSGSLYIEYYESLFAASTAIGAINDVADIDLIDGPLDPDNKLKWGVYRALLNSNGTLVKYTSVADESSLDSWQEVLGIVDGKDDLYNLVPLTNDKEVQTLYEAHVNAESGETQNNWKGMFVNLVAVTSKMVVGESSEGDQLLHPTSTDGAVVLATLADDPQATGTQYTRLSVPEGNAGFLTYDVAPGDTVRYLFTIDAFGEEQYTDFTVDSVLSESSLLLLDGNSEPVEVAQKIEIHHALSKSEIVVDLKDQAQAFSNRRVCATWPDFFGTNGVTVPGYFLGCILAGMRSGVQPHQGLTNVAVSGGDDFARSTSFFSDTQLDDLADSGIWIVTEDQDGTPHTRHALTTDTLDLNRREEVIRVNVDSMSYQFLGVLQTFIGRTNVTDSMLSILADTLNTQIQLFKTSGTTDELGSQLIDGELTVLQKHPLFADRVEAVIALTVPAPMNNIELHLVV